MTVNEVSDVRAGGPVPPVRGGGRGGIGGLGTAVLRVRELAVLVVNIVLVIAFAVSSPGFFTSGNISNIANFTSAAAIIAAGEVFLLVCGDIDLSAGMTFALMPIVMVTLNTNHGFPLGLGLVVGLLIAAVIGLFNGLVTQFLKLPSFITTLGTLYVVHGLTLQIAGSTPLPAPQASDLTGFSRFLVNLLGGTAWSEIGWAVAVAVVLQVVLTQTRWGAHTIATGANTLGSSEAGIKTRQIRIRAFVLTAVLAGLAGVLDGTHISQSFDPNAGGNNLMFLAVASCVIGGTALLGGSGTVIGAFLGALLLGVLQDGFNIRGISANTFVVVEGIAILLAMVLNTYLARFRRGAKEA